MPQVEMQTVDPTYASALVSAPSPTSSIGSRLPDDETDLEDAALTQEEFDAKCWAALKIDEPTAEETSAMRRPVYHAVHRIDPKQAGGSAELVITTHLNLRLLPQRSSSQSSRKTSAQRLKGFKTTNCSNKLFSEAPRLDRIVSRQQETSTPSCRACY